MNAVVLRMPGAEQRRGAAGLGDRRADEPADERVRAARRNPVVPGDEVPGDRADQRAEDHVRVDELGETMPLPTVAATFSSKMPMASRLKNAAQITA